MPLLGILCFRPEFREREVQGTRVCERDGIILKCSHLHFPRIIGVQSKYSSLHTKVYDSMICYSNHWGGRNLVGKNYWKGRDITRVTIYTCSILTIQRLVYIISTFIYINTMNMPIFTHTISH